MSEEVNPAESASQNAPSGGVRHLAMIICILLGVFIYAGWRVKSQSTDASGTQPSTAVAPSTLHAMYDNLKAGLTGRAQPTPVIAAATTPTYQPLRSPAPSQPSRPTGAVLSSSATSPVSGLSLSSTPSAHPVTELTGLEGLPLPAEPVTAPSGLTGPSAVTSAAASGGEVGAQTQLDTRKPSIPGAVIAPAGSEKLKAVYEKLKSDPVLRSGTSATTPVTARAVTPPPADPVSVTVVSSSSSPGGGASAGIKAPPRGSLVTGTTATVTSASITSTTGGIKERVKEQRPETSIVTVSGGTKVDSPRNGTRQQKQAEPPVVAVRAERPERAVKETDADDDMIYTVQSTDTLAEIAERFLGAKARAREIYEANRDQLSRPDTLRTGMRLRVPGAVRGDAPLVHVVRSSDSLPSLAIRYFGEATPEAIVKIRKANPALQHGGFKPGLRLVIPAKQASATASTAGAKETPKTSASLKETEVKSETWVVKSGDSLRKIAKSVYGDEDRWKEIFQANRSQLSSANQLRAGQKLDIPQ